MSTESKSNREQLVDGGLTAASFAVYQVGRMAFGACRSVVGLGLRATGQISDTAIGDYYRESDVFDRHTEPGSEADGSYDPEQAIRRMPQHSLDPLLVGVAPSTASERLQINLIEQPIDL